MDCVGVDALAEAYAAGEPVAPEALAHLAVCDRCRRAVTLAAEIHRALGDLDTPRAPGGLSAAVVARVRRERWRAEQALDRGFNVAMASAAGLVLLGVYLLLNLSGLAAVTSEASGVMAAGLAIVMDRVAGALPTYLAAAALIATALAAWWWAERQLSP